MVGANHDAQLQLGPASLCQVSMATTLLQSAFLCVRTPIALLLCAGILLLEAIFPITSFQVNRSAPGPDKTPAIGIPRYFHDTPAACDLHSGNRQAPPGLVLVPAMWASAYPAKPWHLAFDTCEYQRHNQSRKGFVYNRGFEAGIYLRFIIDHYNNLPDVVAFIQEDADGEIGDRLKCLRTENRRAWGWAPLFMEFVENRNLSVWRSRGDSDAVHACWSAIARDFNLSLPADRDPVVSFYCCAYFAISKEFIRRHSRTSYLAAYDRTVNAERCTLEPTWQGRTISNFGNDKDTSAGAFEHLQHALLGGQKLQMAQFSNEDWCKRFLPNAVCPGSPCYE